MIIRPKKRLPNKLGNLYFYTLSADANMNLVVRDAWINDTYTFPTLGIIKNPKSKYLVSFFIIDGVWRQGRTKYIGKEETKEIMTKCVPCEIPRHIKYGWRVVYGSKLRDWEINQQLSVIWNEVHPTL